MAATIELLNLLGDAGVQQLREGDREIAGACPRHVQRTGHADRHPSWSISKHTYKHHCFSCGYGGSLDQLLSDLTGAAPGEDLVQVLKEQSLVKRWTEARAEPRPLVESLVPRLTDWSLLNTLRDVPQRFLERRRLKREAIDAYQVRYSADTKQVVMPIRSATGELLGAQYRQVGSVLTLPPEIPKSKTLFGYSLVSRYDFAAIVESPLDAVRLFGAGVPAVAALGAWVSADQIRLLSLAFSVVYLALDNDKAGRDGAEIVRRGLRRRHTAAVDWDYTGLVDAKGRKAKDVGDVADDDSLREAWGRTQRFGW